MGLSNEERLNGIYHSVNSLVKDACYLIDNFSNTYHRSILNLARDIKQNAWAKLLSGSSNSAFWIMGSSDFGQTLNPENLYDAALLSHQKQDDCNYGITDKAELKKHQEAMRDADFWTKAFQARQILDNQVLNFVYQIIPHLDNIVYRMNRYDDEMSRRMKDFEAFICNLRGQVFNILSLNEVYLKTYLLEKIADKTFNAYADKNAKGDDLDIFSVWVKSACIHHNYKVREHAEESVDFYQKIWESIQFVEKDNISVQKKFEIFLQIIGRHFHYDHQHKELLSLLEKNKIPTGKISRLLKDCKKKYEIQKKIDSEPTTKHCWLTKKSG